VTKYLRKTNWRRKALFWLMVSEASVHGHLAPVAWVLGGGRTSWQQEYMVAGFLLLVILFHPVLQPLGWCWLHCYSEAQHHGAGVWWRLSHYSRQEAERPRASLCYSASPASAPSSLPAYRMVTPTLKASLPTPSVALSHTNYLWKCLQRHIRSVLHWSPRNFSIQSSWQSRLTITSNK
jgi:hypothetical protein